MDCVHLHRVSTHHRTQLRKTLEYAAEDIAIQYTYPRLDAEVSKHRNHLLKAPFCVHPKTSRVCVPVDPANIERFDPGRVPTVGQLLGELDKAVADASDKEGQDGGEHRSGEYGFYVPCSYI